jgi:hypothetical protein
MTEVYGDDSFRAFPLCSTQEEKPRDTLETRQGVTVYKDWYDTERAAVLAIERRNALARQTA